MKTMDTEKLKMGWALFIVSGLYARENAKVKRWLKREGFVKLATNTYARSCVIGYEGLEKLVQKWEALNTVETKVQAIYLTRHQWDHSYVRMGLATSPVREFIATRPFSNLREMHQKACADLTLTRSPNSPTANTPKI